jgi:5-methylcytosine-specific restriction endonuclease McrA
MPKDTGFLAITEGIDIINLMGYPKPLRAKNPALLKKLKKLPCMICGRGPVDIDHIQTRGSGGGDSADNCWPLCRDHHQERHAWGIKTFVDTYRLPVSFEEIYPRLTFQWQL